MPTYDYICSQCGDRFEHFQSMTSTTLSQKPSCEDDKCNVKRVVSGGTGLIFKGTGFYLTDYKNKVKTDKLGNTKKGKIDNPKPQTKKKIGDTKK